MSNQPNINLNQGTPPPPAAVGGQKSSSNSALFQPGMIGLTSAALLNVMALFTKIADLEGDQFVQQIESAKTTAKHLGEYQKQMGVEEFHQYLVQGISQIVGGAISLGTLYVSERNIGSDPKLSETQEQLEGVENYQKALQARSENPPPQSLTEDTSPEAQAEALKVKNRLDALASTEKFVGADGKAIQFNETTKQIAGPDGNMISTLGDPEAEQLRDTLNERAKNLKATQRQQLEEQTAARQTASTVGQGLQNIITGGGSATSANCLQEKAAQQAAATEAQAALQGEQQVGQNTQGQFTKAVQSATEIDQNLASIAASNALK